jgi:hypothetical protein
MMSSHIPHSGMPGPDTFGEAMTGSFNALLRASYSTATAESVGSFLATWYELPGPVECTLLHRGFNDSLSLAILRGSANSTATI